MRELEDKIRAEGKVFPGDVLKVDSFLNHQVDTAFMQKIGKEFKRLYENENITKILTIEASGISMALATAYCFDFCPLVFAKKGNVSSMDTSSYVSKVHSYTHNHDYHVHVSKNYLKKDDVVLIIDDFLANGEALNGLLDICEQAGCKVVGCGVAVEKAYQPGGRMLRDRGVRIESLARVSKMTDDGLIEFC